MFNTSLLTVPLYGAAPYTTMTDCVRQTLKANGLRGPFQGLGATVLRDTPAFGVYFGTFEVIKGKLAEHQGVRREDLGAREAPPSQ